MLPLARPASALRSSTPWPANLQPPKFGKSPLQSAGRSRATGDEAIISPTEGGTNGEGYPDHSNGFFGLSWVPLAFSSSTARRLASMPKGPIAFNSSIEGICQDASDAGEPVRFSGPRGVTISGRPTALRRAVSNLVDNAVKYGRSAAVSLIPETERVVITVEDEGPGIPRSEREKVVDPFYRIEGARNPDTGSVGLGLAVTRSIIWEHGGDISLAARKGGSLSVRLALPAGPGPSSPDQE